MIEDKMFTSLISKAEAVDKNLNRFFTGKPCKRGHISSRYVKGGHCIECHNKKEVSSKHSQYTAAWRNRNREKIKQYAGEYRQRLEVKASKAKRQQERHVNKLKSEYKWDAELHDFVMEEAYSLSQLRTVVTGVKHNVDHIIPLRGKLVCGLHVWNNIRVITYLENILKSNKIYEDLL
jgi:hypothetical protein